MRWRGQLKRGASRLLLLLGVAAIGFGAYTLYLAHEIATVERHVVVPLPTDEPESTPPTAPTPTPLAADTPTPVSSPIPLPTSTTALTPMPSPSPPPPLVVELTVEPPVATTVAPAIQPTVEPTAQPTEQPTEQPAPTPPPATPFAPEPAMDVATAPAPPAILTQAATPTFVVRAPAPQPTPRPPAPTVPRIPSNSTLVPLMPAPTLSHLTATPMIAVLPTMTPRPVTVVVPTSSRPAEPPRATSNTPPMLPPPSPTAKPLPPPSPPRAPLLSPTPVAKPAAMLTPVMPAPPMRSEPSTPRVLWDGVSAATGESDGHEAVWGGKQYVHVLLMGIDRHDNVPEPSRSDTMILATVNLWDGAVSLLSIPRDLIVSIPGYGDDRVNAAFAYGQAAHPSDPAAGPALAVKTVSRQFDVPIEHYLFVDFKGFKAIVDDVGGVDLLVPRTIDDWQYPTDDYGTTHLHFDTGRQHMNGDRALAYARTRHMTDDNDRRDRQMQVMQAVLLRALQIDGAHRLPDIVKQLGNNMQTSLPYEAQLSLIKIGRKIQANGVTEYSIKPPLVRSYITAAGADVYEADWNTMRSFVVEAMNPKRKAKP